MQESHPDRWRYGGILTREVWPGRPRIMNRWDGEAVYVNRGEIIQLLKTGSEEMVFVDVVRA